MKEVFVRLDRCQGCKSCEMACAVEHSASKNIFAAVSEKPRPVRRIYVEMAEGEKVPLVCRHCEDAPCVAVCRTGAMTQDPLTGIVERSEENCVGCWMCAMVCPYGVIGRHTEVRKAVKCDRCKSLDVPACVAACPTGALIFATQREFVEMMRKEAAARIAREARGLARA
ncbi:MAG TPA: 4Fe-4S dicluster domain-containing protein [Methanothrix sp.]|nr:4Fe-4S dicluster domain-containing protein [Methanothrix sp.]HPT19860.1 4Fe-4S dicluster domain-containing protein [Methanothrix sp.]